MFGCKYYLNPVIVERAKLLAFSSGPDDRNFLLEQLKNFRDTFSVIQFSWRFIARPVRQATVHIVIYRAQLAKFLRPGYGPDHEPIAGRGSVAKWLGVLTFCVGAVHKLVKHTKPASHLPSGCEFGSRSLLCQKLPTNFVATCKTLIDTKNKQKRIG